MYTKFMNTAVINIKTNPKVKSEVQKLSRALGISVSALINAYLQEIVRSKKITFSTEEKPNKYLNNANKQAEKDLKKRKGSPTFDNAENAIKRLNDPKAKYQNGDRV